MRPVVVLPNLRGTGRQGGVWIVLAVLVAAALAASLLLLMMVASPARADTTFTVNSNADADDGACATETNGDCTLREAINAANAASGNDTIVFDLGQTSTITLGSQLPGITDGGGLTVDGQSASITISGNEQVSVFVVEWGANLALSNLTVADGYSKFNGGSGVWNRGNTVQVENTTFSNNSGNTGGSIINAGSGGSGSGGTMTVTNSTFSNNISRAFMGAGIFNYNGAKLTVTNSTFSGNTAFSSTNPDSFGGGIYNSGGDVSSSSTLTVTNSTFSENSADAEYDFGGGGIHNVGGGKATLRNTIVASSNPGRNCDGTITDGGYNMDNGTSCGFSAANNSKPSTDPLLDPNGLQDNGGPTKTIALQEGSPAIDKGNSFGSTTDQRGEQRPQDDAGIQNAPGGDGSDIGALEVDQIAPTLTSIDDEDEDDQVAAEAPLSYTLTFSEDIDESTLTAADLDNAGTAGVSIGTITESSSTPGTFTVEVTPTSTGTLVLGVKDGAVVEDLAGNELETPVQDDTSVTVVDRTAPTLTSIDDGDADDQVAGGETLSYTLTFSEDIDKSTLTAEDLDNAGSATISIGTITESATTPGVFTLQVTPTSVGTLVLRVKDGAVVEDLAGNELDTPVVDDTTVTVVNGPSMANNDSYTIAKKKDSITVPASRGVLANDTDPENDPLTAIKATDPTNGTLTLNSDGSFTYKPRAGFSGTDSFTYNANDGTNDSNVATVTLTLLDTKAPTISSVTPTNGKTGVSRTTPNITVTFSEPVDKATVVAKDPTTKKSVNVKLTNMANGNQVAATVSCDADLCNKVTITPNRSLKANTKYMAIVTTGVEDLAGNSLDQDPTTTGNQRKDWTFTTRR